MAICEQSETPETFKKRGGKGPLPRDVVRVVTPGTLQEDELLQAQQHNFLAAIGRVSAELAIAWADMSTGDFFVQSCTESDIETVLARLQAAELIYADDLAERLGFVNQICPCITIYLQKLQLCLIIKKQQPGWLTFMEFPRCRGLASSPHQCCQLQGGCWPICSVPSCNRCHACPLQPSC